MSGEDIVVGSGPAGVSAAAALLAKGRRVRILDVGESLEAERSERRDRMGAQAPAEWSAEDLAAVQGPRRAAHTDGMRPYGSDFPIRSVLPLVTESRDFGLRPSFARGGLSNGWGAAVLPYRLEDLADWPAPARNLAPHYEAVSRLMPIAGVVDDLAELFPMWTPSGRSLAVSAQADAILKRLAARRDALAGLGMRFGRARQAVAEGCRACAMCLYGCPYRLIFNAANALERVSTEALSYEPGWQVASFEEDSAGVAVHARRVGPGQSGRHTFRADRLFLAAGVLPTAHIVLSALGAPGQTLTLRDSQYALTPMLAALPAAHVETEPRHTLTQIFLEDVRAQTVHTQIYTYNDLFAIDLRRRFAKLPLAADALARALARRLVVGQTFVHSDLSAQAALSLRGHGEDARLEADVRPNANTLPAFADALAQLRRAFLPIGVAPLTFQSRIGPVGSSFHCGGTLAMRAAPQGLETDPLGRPAGLARTHVVDASVFPSIPATTITFTVMANAHRIATESVVPDARRHAG